MSYSLFNMKPDLKIGNNLRRARGDWLKRNTVHVTQRSYAGGINYDGIQSGFAPGSTKGCSSSRVDLKKNLGLSRIVNPHREYSKIVRLSDNLKMTYTMCFKSERRYGFGLFLHVQAQLNDMPYWKMICNHKRDLLKFKFLSRQTN